MSATARAGAAASPYRDPNKIARLSIGQVLEQLVPEFPSLTVSKLRFLEDQGLVTPERTASGYRKYSLADVERLRFVLVCQRDQFWPLKVIRERLDELDAAGEGSGLAHVVAVEGDGQGEAHRGRLTAEALAAAAGVDVALITELSALGLLRPGPTEKFAPSAVEIVKSVSQLAAHGVETRHLRAFRVAAEREAGLVDQVVAPWRASREPGATAQADAVAQEVAAACVRLHAALLTGNLAQSDG